MQRRSTRLSGGSLELELHASPPITKVLKTTSANTNAVLQRTTSAWGFKRKADDEGLGTTKKKTTKKKASGSIARTIPQSQSLLKWKGKARATGLGLSDSRQPRGALEDAEVLEGERRMARQRSELDARERDNQRRVGRTPNKPRPPANQSSSSVLSRVALDSIEPGPISNTPVFVRNREIRQASQSRRRSSLSSRAPPHPSVPPDTFFRHVDSDLPEPSDYDKFSAGRPHRPRTTP
ncbi:hypothetical protein FRC07_012305 [Ceratobasidium sp. 392]|nr:hypothetical protein FRC07_012305 [Ceratobasidium sp. 392]